MVALVTLLLILASFVGACRYRAHWAHFSGRRKTILMLAASLLVAAYTFMFFTGWHFTSPLANDIAGSLMVGGYSLIVLLVTLFRPKLLTECLAILLLLPVPAALVVLPWSLYSRRPIETEHIAGTLFVNKVRWDAGAMGSSGTTLLIYHKPRFVPFLAHTLQKIVFDDAECLSGQAFVVLQADDRHVLARCPWPEYLHRQGFHDFLVPLF